MESLLVLAGLVIFGIPIVLFLLVIGARRRVSVLERSVEQLQRELSLLHEQVSTPHVTASVGSSATARSPSVVPPSGPAESAALRSTDKATAVCEPEPELLSTSATEPEQPLSGQGREEYDPGPVSYTHLTLPTSDLV